MAELPESRTLPLRYTPYPETVSCYDTRSWHWFEHDQLLDHSGLEQLPGLAASPHWEDRIRAEVLRQHAQVLMPPQFPVLYERADSPNRLRHSSGREFYWVASPDRGMLEDLLHRYQELWNSYTSQWGDDSRRVFAVGLRDDVPANRVTRPGVSPEQLLVETLLNHQMENNAPQWALDLLRGKKEIA